MAGWKYSKLQNTEVLGGLKTSRTNTLGRVTPQAPGNRTVFCNDRQANAYAKYKVLLILYTHTCMHISLHKIMFNFILCVGTTYKQLLIVDHII